MNGPNIDLKSYAELKARVEYLLGGNLPDNGVSPSEEILALLQDLWDHQIQLKNRNQQLHSSYEKLEKSKGYYENLIELSSIGYLTLDSNNIIHEVNIIGAEILGIEKSRLRGKKFLQFISSGSEDHFHRHRKQCIESRKIQTCNLKLKTDRDHQRYVKLESLAVANNEGEFNQIRAAMVDITDRIMADKRIKTLSRELLSSQETERRMIARELHDSVAQELSAVKIGYDTLIHDHAEISQEIKQRTLTLSKILEKTIMIVRDLSYDLRPPGLEKFGIIQCLFNFCTEFKEKSGVNVDFFTVGMENIDLDDFAVINIYRLVQEGLNNVFKHAQASNVDVMFSYTHPDIVLRITDNGVGFDVEKRLAAITSEKRMGLRSMQERVTLLGGSMSVQSIIKHGTKIVIRLPYGEDENG